MRRFVITALPLLFLLAPRLHAQGAPGEQVFLTTGAALREVFPRAVSFAPADFRPSPAQRASLEQRLGRPLPEAGYPFLLAYDASRRLLGYALVTEERGKYRPITFLVGIQPNGAVRGVAVMVYRESRGGEVRYPRFLAQYRGKTARSPIRANADIINVSGATISVQSMNNGVRKVLALVETAFGASRPTLAAGALRPISALR